ncbi:hypothetical protein Goari_014363, partial [Gossypium aridum]|nr:hypothetical protein [Gossypium aridum]
MVLKKKQNLRVSATQRKED